jgi:murein DD-endopeptidase MepM/ murein hydrolase activator NlpD
MSFYSFTKYTIALFIFLISFTVAFSQEVGGINDLHSKIEEKNQKIKKLEEEIKVYNQEVIKTTTEAKTLQNTIKTLDVTDKKLKKDLSLTENKIVKTSLVLEDTKDDISKTENKIGIGRRAISESLKSLHQKESTGLLENIMTYKKFTDLWTLVDNIKVFGKALAEKSVELKKLKEDLLEKQTVYQNEKSKLAGLKEDLSDQKKIIEQNKNEKSTLLSLTKNKEAEYKKILKQKEAEKNAFEKELFEYESQLQYFIDPSKLPTAKSGILSWPLDDVYITQRFGVTNASKRLYVSGSHNGVDFKASLGTPVKASLSGTVWGTGNTDEYKGCYSFGKWVMVKHLNGLSTIYGHLSSIRVTSGQEVKTGDLVGFSGNTGYSTGPHLHLGVYATQGVRIEKFINSRGCKDAILPLADIKAYLDPMLYLPS